MLLQSRKPTFVLPSCSILSNSPIGLLSTFLLLFFNFILIASADSPNCTCYRISGASAPSYFLYHRFYDFRGITPASAADDFTRPAPPLLESQENNTQPATCSFLNSTAFQNEWSIQSWTQNATADAPVRLVNSPQNVYIQRSNPASSSTHLTLRTSRLSTFQSAAELDSNLTIILHASVRIRARITGADGAVAAFFTFGDNTNESDIEILTRDPVDQFRGTNQPSVDSNGNVVPDASRILAVPASGGGGGNGTWNDWTTYRLDWLPTHSAFWANNVSLSNNTYSVPKKPSQFIMNIWGNGGVWSGKMSVGQEARLDVEWIEMVYNTSAGGAGPEKRDVLVEEVEEEEDGGLEKRGKKNEGDCAVMCSVDAETVVGTPVLVSGASSRSVIGTWWVLCSALGLGVYPFVWWFGGLDRSTQS